MTARTISGSNQRPLPLLHDIDGGSRTVTAVKDLERLSKADQPCKQRDVMAGEAVRVSMTVPMFIETVDCAGGGRSQPQVAHNVRTLIAAQPDKYFGVAMFIADHGANIADALETRLFGMSVLERVEDAVPLETSPVRGARHAFGPYIVVPDDLVDAR